MEKLSPRNAFHVLLLSLLMLSITARAAEITKLPGQPEDVRFAQYSGYVSIKEEKRLFYWLVEASTDAEHKPLLLWLNGGPGCSSIGYGAFQEIGPFRVLPNGKLSKRQFSWNTEANLLFLDSPSGVGYSVRSVVEPAGDNSTAMDSYAFLNKWLEVFPKFKYRDFYLAGESYAGHYVPQLAQVIVNHNNGLTRPKINLKGFLLGNPTLDPGSGNPGRYEYFWNHGLISDTTYENMRKFCTVDGDPEGCHKAWIEANANEIGDVNGYNIYVRPCGNNSTQDLMYRNGDDFCLETDTVKYMRRKEVQESFHVQTSYVPLNYTLCSEWNVQIRYSKSDTKSSVLPILKELIGTHLQIYIYSGTTDATVPLSTTRRNIAALKLKVQKKWYPWNHNDQLAVWIEVYEGLTFVAVMGSGHEVPMYLPSQAHALFRSFLSNAPMPKAPFKQ
ncbi:hypothetical protein ACJRO7_006166 [Eucalyptus globulus]|uniref:Carboxypeptidase n=1 Tax=Eucalyptus globulus TaxID=34317 RepID=A0ABD3IKH2_EUCGL